MRSVDWQKEVLRLNNQVKRLNEVIDNLRACNAALQQLVTAYQQEENILNIDCGKEGK